MWRALLIVAALVLGAVAPVLGATATSLDAEWIAPTTNTDGSPLQDLAGYRVYVGALQVPVCPSSTFRTVAAARPDPQPGTRVPYLVSGLSPLTTYTVRVTAVDTSGNQSACSGTASATTLAQVIPPPPTASASNPLKCEITLTGDPPDTQGGWTAWFLRGSTLIGGPVTAPPYVKVDDNMPRGSSVYAVRWTRQGAVIRSANLTRTCP
jgi:hypothetical protein